MIVIGAGRIGTALAGRASERGLPCTLVERERGWEALDGVGGTPILVAVRNDDLDDVLRRLPSRRRRDLVFLQNGMIRPWLREHGLQQLTRGLLWFAVTSRGGPIEPGWPAVFTGEHGPAVTAWFRALDLEAESVDWMRFSTLEAQKLLWLSAMGVLCELYGMTVGEVATKRTSELAMLLRELAVVVASTSGVDFPIGWLVTKTCEYSLTIPGYRASVKEWRWRNGWFDQKALEWGMATPLHHDMLRAIGKGDLIALRG